MAKKSEWQLKLQAILDLCRDNYGWSRGTVAEMLNMNGKSMSDHVHNGRSTTKRMYYAVYGLVAEHEIKKKKKKD